jgi:hypothetical protein
VEISSKGGGSISIMHKYLHPNNLKSTLKLTRVEVVEMSEVFSEYI